MRRYGLPCVDFLIRVWTIVYVFPAKQCRATVMWPIWVILLMRILLRILLTGFDSDMGSEAEFEWNTRNDAHAWESWSASENFPPDSARAHSGGVGEGRGILQR